MHQEHAVVRSLTNLTADIKRLTLHAPSICRDAQPGHFLNIRVDANFPLLRRPFSIFDIDGEELSIIFNVIGRGTAVLARKEPGDTLDVIGPAGNSFLPFTEGHYDTSIFIAGGIGVAPFPFFTKRMDPARRIESFIGARSAGYVVDHGMKNTHIATDDGSTGYHGTVLDLLKGYLDTHDVGSARMFLCGPSRMMRAVAEYTLAKNIPAYASIECDMACGIGLCQGCAIESNGGDKKYFLVCTDGTIFDTRTVKI